MTHRAVFRGALTVLVADLALLLAGAGALEWDLLPGAAYFPLGTLVAWTAICALPLLVYTGRGSLRRPVTGWDRAVALLLRALIVWGAVWGVLAYLALGNWALNFEAGISHGEISSTFWLMTALAVLLPLPLLVLHALVAWIMRRRRAA